MKQGGQILTKILGLLKDRIQIGMSTKQIDQITKQYLESHQVESAFFGYHGFPAHLCVSINDEVVHGLPTEREIADGDLISLDLGVKLGGLITDASISFAIGHPSAADLKLIAATHQVLKAGVDSVSNGITTGDLGFTIDAAATKLGYQVVYDLSGHGVGRQLHEAPNIPNFGQKGSGTKLITGLTIAIEPMLVAKKREVDVDQNNWTIRTIDGGRAAHFEVTVAVTEHGREILTPNILD